MGAEKKIIVNTFLLGSGKLLGDFCAFAFLAILGRAFGAGILGTYSFSMSIAGLMVLFVSLGLNTLVIREVSRVPSKGAEYIGNILVGKGVLSAIVWTALILFAALSGMESDRKWILIMIGGYQVFFSLAGLLNAGFIAHEEMKYPAFLESFHRVVILALGGASLLVWHNPVITMAALPLSAISMFIVSFHIYAARYGTPHLSFDYAFFRKSIIVSFSFFLIIIVSQLYDRIGIIFLTLLRGDAETGIFSAGDRLVAAAATLLFMFRNSLFPVLGRLSADAREEMFTLCERLARLLVLLLFPGILLIFVLAGWIIRILFGTDFAASAVVLRIDIWSLLFLGLYYILSTLLIAVNHQRILIRMDAAVCAGYMLLSVLLIQRFGYIGLAWARLFSAGALFFTVFLYIRKRIYPIRLTRLIAPGISGLTCLLFLAMLPHLQIWEKLPAVLSVYGLCIWMLKGIEPHDLIFARKLFSQGPGA